MPAGWLGLYVGSVPIDLQPGEPAAFLCAVMAGSEPALAAAAQQLAARFGPVRAASPVYPFPAQYYAPEMGPGLVKGLLWLGDLVDPAELSRRKAATLDFERERAIAGPEGPRRTVNVDPGMLSAGSLVLATTKSRAHRIAIAPSLYAEVTLLFESGTYRPLPWTYADYRRPDVGQFLLQVRSALLGQTADRRACR